MYDKYDPLFWQTMEQLIEKSKLVIDRCKDTPHSRYPDFIYPVDYGYLQNTQSMDGNGIDVWYGTLEDKRLDSIICTVDVFKNDSEIKLLIGCTDLEKEKIYKLHNQNKYMKGIFIQRDR
ncbi:MAG: inorganic pyrophosphatase [Clostridiales bacterium]|nr:inorganic pyrophosphatase [Clostridiales bacterium]